MNIQNIQLIYEYNCWASGKILAAAKKLTEEQFLAPGEYPFGGLRGTLTHILDAEWGWRTLFETNVFSADLCVDAGETGICLRNATTHAMFCNTDTVPCKADRIGFPCSSLRRRMIV